MFDDNIWPRKSWHPLALGTIVEAVGITLLAVPLKWGHLRIVYSMLGLTGVGIGLRVMRGTLHRVGCYRKNIASIVSLMSLAISLGGTLASKIMLKIFNNKISGTEISLVRGASSALSLSQIESLSPERKGFEGCCQEQDCFGFLHFYFAHVLGVLAVTSMGNVDIKKDSKDADTNEDGDT